MIPELDGVPVNFWICQDCPGAHVSWDGPVATCLRCGKTNKTPLESQVGIMSNDRMQVLQAMSCKTRNELYELCRLQQYEIARLKLPESYVLLPRSLTAENGAKALLIGEFHESIEVQCLTCGGDGRYDTGRPEDEGKDCPDCDGSGMESVDVPVSWTNIKKIYAMAVEHFAGKS